MPIIRINNLRVKVRTELFLGLMIMLIGMYLYAGASLYALGVWEKSLGLYYLTVALSLVGAFIASLEVSREKETKQTT